MLEYNRMTVEGAAIRRDIFFAQIKKQIIRGREHIGQRMPFKTPHKGERPPEASELETVPSFTPRDLQVLERIALGMHDSMIEHDLDMAKNTVKTHRYNIHARVDPTFEMTAEIAFCKAILIASKAELIDLSPLQNHPNNVLTNRELNVLRSFGSGQSREEIARKLSIARSTLNKHLNNIYPKIQAHSIEHAVSIDIATNQVAVDTESKRQKVRYKLETGVFKAIQGGASVSEVAKRFTGKTRDAVKETYNKRAILPEAYKAITDGSYIVDDPSETAQTLTAREKEIVAAVLRGKISIQELADDLTISMNTAKTHVSHIHKKIGTKSIVGIGLFGLSIAVTVGVIKVRNRGERGEKEDSE